MTVHRTAVGRLTATLRMEQTALDRHPRCAVVLACGSGLGLGLLLGPKAASLLRLRLCCAQVVQAGLIRHVGVTAQTVYHGPAPVRDGAG